MAAKLTKLNKTGLEQVEKILEKYATKCHACKIPLDENYTGIQKTKDGYMCDDCYFEEWGKLVEEHPICSPRRIGR